MCVCVYVYVCMCVCRPICVAELEWARTEMAKDKVVHVDVRKGLGYT